MTTMKLVLTVNDRTHAIEVDPRLTLLDLLRDTLGLTGTKRGCEIGECGACTVLVDGVAVSSCLVLAPQVEGRRITTVEGLGDGRSLTPLQDAFLDHDAVHCGYCTPGMLMSAKDLLEHNPSPTERDIRVAISGNLCRCTRLRARSSRPSMTPRDAPRVGQAPSSGLVAAQLMLAGMVRWLPPSPSSRRSRLARRTRRRTSPRRTRASTRPPTSTRRSDPDATVDPDGGPGPGCFEPMRACLPSTRTRAGRAKASCRVRTSTTSR